jgi:hypothetical protein
VRVGLIILFSDRAVLRGGSPVPCCGSSVGGAGSRGLGRGGPIEASLSLGSNLGWGAVVVVVAGPLLGLVVGRGGRGRRGCSQGLQLGSKGSELEQKGSSRAFGRGPRKSLHAGEPRDLGGDGRRDRVHETGKLGPFLLGLVLELKEGPASGLKV